MALKSKIEWTDATANLWHGCTQVGPECYNCFAENDRYNASRGVVWGEGQERLAIASTWKNLQTLQRQASRAGIIKRVFVGSMMDVFEKSKPVMQKTIALENGWTNTGQIRDKFFREVHYFPNLRFQLLTKRPSNINKMIPDLWKALPPQNVLFGASIGQQGRLQTIVSHLQNVNGYRFLSIEPQLEYMDLTKVDMTGIHWIIQGGESGPNRRPFDVAWAYAMKDQCQQLGIPYFFKQIDKIQEIPDDLLIRQFPFADKFQLQAV